MANIVPDTWGHGIRTDAARPGDAMNTQKFLYRVLILLSAFGLGFAWGDTLARQMRKGNDAFAAGRYDEALNAYTEADVGSRADDPRLPHVYNNMGTVLHRQGRYEQAEAMYRKALEASPDSDFKADVLFNSGNTRFTQGDYQHALEAYDQALEQQRNHAQALQNKQIVEQLIEQQQEQQQQQQQEQQEQQEQQQQDQENDQPQDEQTRADQSEHEGQSEPTPTPTAGPDDQQAEEPPADDHAEQPEQDLSAEEALRILDALMEKEHLRQEQRQVPPRPVEKDW